MKKGICILICFVISMTSFITASAKTYIHYTFMDEQTGYVYHFGEFEDGDIDAGVYLNDVQYSLKGGTLKDGTPSTDGNNAFLTAQNHGNIFGIGFYTGSSLNSYTIEPYYQIEGQEPQKGQAMTVNKAIYTDSVEIVKQQM